MRTTDITQSHTGLTRYIIVILLISSVMGMITTIPNAYSVTSFGSLKNLSSDATFSTDPQVVTSGGNVYVVWTNIVSGEPDILFSVSTDNGVTFSSPVSLSSNAGITTGLPACSDTDTSLCRGYPDIAVSGNNVYVIWQDNDGTDDEIYFRKTTDNGATFVPPIISSATNVSNDGNPSAQAKIVAEDVNVHVTWAGIDPIIGDVDIFYSRSIDGGSSFISPIILSNNVEETTSLDPDIAVSGNNVYVVWQEDIDSSVTYDIFFQASTNNGVTFNSGSPGSPVNLFNNDALISQNPVVAASGTNVYVAWEDGNDGTDLDIFFRSSTDNGATFDPVIASTPNDVSSNTGDSTNPQLSTNSDGTKIYLAWQDPSDGDNDILFKQGLLSGSVVTFGSEKPVSDNSANSIIPRMSASGDNVYITWKDDVFDPGGTYNLLFKSSTDGGDTFSSSQDLTDSTTTLSDFQQITSSGGNVFVVWRDGPPTPGATDEISFKAGAVSATDVAFDKSQYRISDTATITVIAPTGTGPRSVDVSSSVDPGFTISVTEIGTSGVYTGTIGFTTGSSISPTTLKVAAGSTITATDTGLAVSGTASIFPAAPSFQFDTYTLSAGAVGTGPVLITVTDQNANTNPATIQTVPITVSSPSDTISLTLTETGANTGVFRNSKLIFMTGNDLVSIGNTATITQTETTGTITTNGIVDTISVIVKSTTFPTGFSLTLTETGPNTGVFTNTLTFSGTGPSGGTTIQVSAGDIVSVTYIGESENALVIPNSNAGVGALQATIGSTITATYLGATDTATIGTGLGGGGGGGGLVRPGMVLNVLAAVGGGGGDASAPLFALNKFQQKDFFGNPIPNDPFKPILPATDPKTTYPLSINGKGYGISSYANTILTNTIKTTEPVQMDLVFFEATSLQHVALNFASGDDFSDTAPTITFEKGQLQVSDPNGVFGDGLKATITKDGTKYVLHYDISFVKPGELNLIVRAWDDKKNTAETKIFDAFNVVQSTAPPPPSENAKAESGLAGTVVTENVTPQLPKSEADKLMSVIKEWGGFSSESVSDSELLKSIGVEADTIPSWFKDTTRWVIDGDVSTQEFVDAIKYLNEKGIIK